MYCNTNIIIIRSKVCCTVIGSRSHASRPTAQFGTPSYHSISGPNRYGKARGGEGEPERGKEREGLNQHGKASGEREN